LNYKIYAGFEILKKDLVAGPACQQPTTANAKLFLVLPTIPMQNLANFRHREGHQFELQNLCWF
jgi:hypothetical protein